MTVDKKLSYAIVSKYEKEFKRKTGRPIVLNRFKEKWAAEDLVESFGYDRVCLAMDYMLSVGQQYSWQFFVKNCGNILNYYDNLKIDEEERAERKEIAREWLSS